MSTSSTPGTEPEPKGGAGPMRPEQFLREESERITALLQMRRRATTVIAAIFALATVCAVFMLARYVQGEQRRINDLGARLTSADDRMKKQEEWLNRLRKNSDLVDSILTQYRTLIAGVQDSTKHYSDSLAAKLDVRLQSRIQSTERNAALWDTAWSKSGRSISDSLGDRLTREETRVMTFMNRLDTIPPRVAQHERQLSDVKAFDDFLRDTLGGLIQNLGRAESRARRDSASIVRIRTDIFDLDTAITATRGRLHQLEAARVRSDSTR